MNTNRKRELAHRAQANAQRRARDVLLAKLSQRLAEVVSRAECVYSPDADLLIRRVWPIRVNGLGTPPDESFSAFRVIETGWSDQVRREIAASSRSNDFDPAVLILPDVKTIHFGNVVEFVPDLPLFQVRFGEGCRLLEELWVPGSGVAAIFLTSFAVGVVVDSYSGYPAENPGPEELTHEIATWGTA